MPEFFDKRGRLTAYSFACGYVESLGVAPDIAEGEQVRVWREHGVYHVRRSDWTRTCDSSRFWLTAHTLASARGFARLLSKLRT